MNMPLEVKLALGRLFRMMSRPERPGDGEDYAACRSIIMGSVEPPAEYSPCYQRDRLKGARGD